MYNPLKFLCGVICAAFLTPAVANVATTAGSNLTAYNGTGATSNNQWNSMMNARTNAAPATAEANFGNCEAIILRCATPKCSSGCGDFSIARPIVAGCVNSNATCKKHGDALIDSLAMQLVAKSNAKIQEQQNAVAIAQAQAQAQAAAASAAAEQSGAQIQQMQSQMAAMQAQMAESMAAMQEQMAMQSESQSAQIQSALAENRTNNVATVAAPNDTGVMIEGLEGLGLAEQLAAKNGINADILVREQIGGQIQTSIDDAVKAMKDLKDTLDATLEYAGCDSSANNCTGPKRVKKFKELANNFFDPYENVVENMYEALMLAMTVGIDVSDVIMLLSGACNMWGKYMCGRCDKSGNYGAEGRCECYGDNNQNCYYRVVTDSKGKVAKEQPHCRLVGILNDGEEVQREWIDANSGMTGSTQVACASDVVMDISLFRGMKKSATLDIETLRNLVNQDAYASCRTSRAKGGAKQTEFSIAEDCGANFCMVNPDESQGRMRKLQNAVATKKLGKRKGAGGYCFDTESAMNNDKESIEMAVIEGCSQYRSKTDCPGTCTWDLVKGVCKDRVLDLNVSCADRKTKEDCKARFTCTWLSASEKCIMNTEIEGGTPSLQFKNSGLTESWKEDSPLINYEAATKNSSESLNGISITTKGLGSGSILNKNFKSVGK